MAIKAKIIIAITVATWFFTLGMKALMALKYGKEFVGKCEPREVVFSPAPSSYSHDFSSGIVETICDLHLTFSSYFLYREIYIQSQINITSTIKCSSKRKAKINLYFLFWK